MSQPIISVEGLGKRYFLSHQKRQDTLRDSITQSVRGFFKSDSSAGSAAREEFWALRDVSFQVNQGDVVGIIGRNGAGKSTLLKILSRIIEPTKGCAVIRGRVASLLEVGTGFHPELSGRENIFLNGAILGMSRVEITRKFDEIVAFAEVKRFLDTQVKHYSSGMYVRLAFAVAAHLEPEILILDEVLSVGDAQFQQRCLGKMQSVASGGRTVLFVSHNLKAVEHFCTRGLLIERGSVVVDASAHAAVAEHLRRSAEQRDAGAARSLNDELDIVSFAIAPGSVPVRGTFEFTLVFAVKRDCQIHDLHLFLCNSFGDRVALLDLRDPSVPGGTRQAVAGPLTFRGRISRLTLVDGLYRIGITVRTARHFQALYDLADIEITAAGDSGNLMPYAPEYQGTTLLDCQFTAASS